MSALKGDVLLMADGSGNAGAHHDVAHVSFERCDRVEI
jgi:hypothetical protein